MNMHLALIFHTLSVENKPVESYCGTCGRYMEKTK
jgi:hypothetical protein